MHTKPHTAEAKEKMRQAKLKNPTRFWLGKGKIKNKVCLNCLKEFFPIGYDTRRKYCSVSCYRMYNIPWNKGKTGVQVSWKKGMTGIYTDEQRYKMGSGSRGVVRDYAFRLKVSTKLFKGNSPLLESIRKCLRYREWRLSVFKRDDYTCQLCNSRGGKLNADHHPIMFIELIRNYNIKSMEEALQVEGLWNSSVGRTLCLKCHILYGRRKPNIMPYE